MAKTKPSVVPKWADQDQNDATSGQPNTATPAATYQDFGWPRTTDPMPRQLFNHQMRYLGRWTEWLNERVFDGGTSSDLTIKGPNAEAGDVSVEGGTTDGTADQSGGDVFIKGGVSTGTGGSEVVLYAATAGTTGTTARVSEPYLHINGSIGLIHTHKPMTVNTDTVYGFAEFAVKGTATQNTNLLLVRSDNDNGWSLSANFADDTLRFQKYTHDGIYDDRITISSAGYLGVGTTAPDRPVQVATDQEMPYDAKVALTPATHRGWYLSRRSQGTVAAPLAVNDTDYLGGLAMSAYDGTDWRFGWNGGAEIFARARENWTATNHGTEIRFSTTAIGATNATERLVLTPEGHLQPLANNTYDLGSNINAWRTVFSNNLQLIEPITNTQRWEIRNPSGSDNFEIANITGVETLFAIDPGLGSTRHVLNFGSLGTPNVELMAFKGSKDNRAAPNAGLGPVFGFFNQSSAGAGPDIACASFGINYTLGANDRIIDFYDAGGFRGAIVGSGANNLDFAGSSDAALKTNIADTDLDCANIIANIPVRQYELISTGEHVEAHYIAQEVEAYLPAMVGMNNDGYRTLGNVGFIPILHRALQQLMDRVTALETP